MTTWADIINGTFEALACLMVLNHCRVLLRDRAVAGVSIASTAFFTLWGVWNLWYYPLLGQFWSTVGGVFVVLANCIYVGLLLRFSATGRQLRKRLGAIVCRFRRCNYDTPVFRLNALYFCTRCGKEICGRTIADLRAMPPLDDEDLEELRREIAH